jgi:hypothetical protein
MVEAVLYKEIKYAIHIPYILDDKDAQLERLAIPIKFVTAERKPFSNADPQHTAAVSAK